MKASKDLYTEGMEIINNSHPLIQKNSSGHRRVFMSVLRDNTIYFTKAAEDDCNIRVGSYMHFLRAGQRWYFYVNSDSTGFLVYRDSRSGPHRGVRILNHNLVAMLKNTVHFSLSARFKISSTGSSHTGSDMFEIIFQRVFKRKKKKTKKK